MKVKEIMTQDPRYCTPDEELAAAAGMMCDANCGELPVLESRESMRLVGVITDRDIACRAVATGKNAAELKVSDCMSSPPIAVTPDTDVDECCDILERNRIRRAPVVDDDGRCCGIVSQADIALKCEPRKAAELLHEVSVAV
jgi:CBS domain-containing protein